jgi:hypothetical protein
MRIKLLSLALALLLPLSTLSTANADNANPPKITSVQQITSGPYSVGDIVTFKVGYEGGYPGIAAIRIVVGCLNNTDSVAGANNSQIGWSKREKTTAYTGNGLVSGYVIPCPLTETYPSRVEIQDETGLRAILNWEELKLNSNLRLQINKSDLLPTPIGEIKPTKIPDEVTLGVPSKVGLNQVYALPRLTKSGAPLFFRTMNKRVCEIGWETFQGDLGGNLRTLSPGICAIRVSVSSSDKYENPTIRTDKIIKPSKSSSTVLNFTVSKTSKSKR